MRFRYSTDAGYLDAGWFVANVTVDGAPRDGRVAPRRTSGRYVDGPEQDNNWSVQVISSCDLTPGSTRPARSTKGRGTSTGFNGDADPRQAGFDTKCTEGSASKGEPHGRHLEPARRGVTFFDAPYLFRLTNTGKGS